MKKLLIPVVAFLSVLSAHAADEPGLTVFIKGRQMCVIGPDGTQMFSLEPSAWSQNFTWIDLAGSYAKADKGVKGTFSGKLRNSDAVATMEVTIVPIDSRRIQVDGTFQIDKPAETIEIISVNSGPGVAGDGRGTFVGESGKDTVIPLPPGRTTSPEPVTAIRMRDAQDRVYEIQLPAPAKVFHHGGFRLNIGDGKIEPGEVRKASFVVNLPEDAKMMLDPAAIQPESDSWFEWKATGHPAADSVLDMSGWLEAPAGKHGRITRKDDRFIYNGKPKKFWGTNINFSGVAPSKEFADKQADLYARYGINAIRMHKIADGPDWQGIVTMQSAVEYDAPRLDLMDYFVSKLKEKGIYIKLSSNFGRLPIGPADLQRIPYATEFDTMRFEGWRQAPQGAIWYAKEIGDLQIEQMVKMLEHENPYTGLRYADDPVVMLVEVVNENSAFFFTLHAMQKSPTVKKLAGEAFFAWLKDRYQTQEALLAAWGANSLGRFGREQLGDESWDQGLIYPVGNPWFFSPAQLEGPFKDLKQRLLDTMLFMAEQQIKYYERYAKAVRAAGYKGEILGSNWVAAAGYSHYMNLYADSTLGNIDRHNYFGGSASMLAKPGGGTLSSGMTQVGNCTFMLSEWIHCFPNEYGVEGPAIVGAYGLGLNGWDISYIFQNYNHEGEFLKSLGRREWEIATPQIMGIFPAVARQVYRGDVKESELTFDRNVYFPNLVKGELGFQDSQSMDYDVKQFDSSTIPAKALAVGRTVVNFTDAPKETKAADLTAFEQGDVLVSSTKQLKWVAGKNSHDGHIVINTPGTQAVVGFAEGVVNDLQDVSITSRSPYGAIYVTALDQDATIAKGKRLLISTIARVHNTGMKYVAGNMVESGKPPLRVEPVTADIKFKRGGKPVVNILDHNGVATGQTLPVGDDGTLKLDGNSTKTVYYEVVYP